MLSKEGFHLHHSDSNAGMIHAKNATDSAKYEQYKCIAINNTLSECPQFIKIMKKKQHK